ncbi:MAG: DUF1573 domain-containing protein [Planctomycetes bacterium]|nr:DUF1573 domain-containing protein [Planctomycetota bacterium]
MTGRRVILSAGVLLIAVVAAAAFGWWYMAAGRFPLKGDVRHDFGDIPILGSEGSAAHTFRLTNKTGETIEIEKIQPSCGCTRAEANPRSVPPGATVEIDVALTLSRPGHKKTHVKMMLAGFGVQTLWIEGTGRKDLVIWPNQEFLRLAPGETTPLIISAARQGSDQPPDAPTIETPEGVRAAFVSWQPMGERETGDPAEPWHWRGRFDVTLDARELPGNSALVVSAGGQTLTVHLAPVRAAPPETPPATPPVDR